MNMNKLIPRDLHIDILQIMRPRALNANHVIHLTAPVYLVEPLRKSSKGPYLFLSKTCLPQKATPYWCTCPTPRARNGAR